MEAGISQAIPSRTPVSSGGTTGAARIPLGHQGAPEQAAAIITFLVSPQAGYVTGQTIVVDGGLLAS